MIKKRSLLVFVLFSLIILASGCETTKGLAKGVGSTAKGVAEDTKNIWHKIIKADAWIKKNLW